MICNKNPAPEDSLKKRYFYKFFTNVIGFFLNLAIQAIVPRGLGPKAYGDFSFLTNFFNQIIGFLDMGSSTCFYTKLSQKPREFKLVPFYLYFIGIASLLILGFVTIVFITKTYIIMLPKQRILYIYLAVWFGILTWIAQVLNSMADAYGLTVSSEIAKTLHKFISFFLILLLYIFHLITLTNFFYYNLLITCFLGIFFVWIMDHGGYSLKRSWRLTTEQITVYSKEFYNYSHPFFISTLVVLIAGVFDRWLLQICGGSSEQGFYSLSYQIGAMCFLFTGAMTPLFTRELSLAYEKKDLAHMAYLFQRCTVVLYSIAVYFSCFIAMQADKVVQIFGGSRFNGAIAAVTIMAFYPIHQTYGQLSSSVFYATRQTKLYCNLGMIFTLLGLPLTYFLIAPVNKLGINAGATGLAAKMVLIGIISTNVHIYFNAKQLGLNFWRLFKEQIFIFSCFLILASSASFGVDYLLGFRDRSILSLFTAGTLYSFMVISAVYFFPGIFGIKKGDIQLITGYLQKIRARGVKK